MDHIEAVSSRRFEFGSRSVRVSTVTIGGTLYCSVYAPLNSSFVLILQALSFVTSTKDSIFFVIAGAFNVRFDRVDDNQARGLSDYLSAKNISSSLPASVVSTTKNATFIDIIFAIGDVLSSGIYVSYISTHEPLWFLI